MADLAKKKRLRAGHRGSTTRMLTQVNKLLRAEEVELARLAQLKLSLQEKLETLKQLDSEVLELTEDKDLEAEIQSADDYKDGIYAAMVGIDESNAKSKRASDTPPVGAGRASVPPASEHEHRIKLPKLTMRPFDGDITQWTTFWDSYDSAIHANAGLTDIDKFNYLRSLLRGAAREAVSGLTLTAANYGEAIAVLKRRFGNKQQIISRHMDVLITLPAVVNNSDVKALRRLYDVVESNVRSLKSLGVPTESYGSLLSTVVMNKLPSELRLIIGRKIGDDEWNLDVILKELLTEVETRERTASPSCQTPSQRRTPSTAAALFASDSQPRCCFCSQPHVSESCTTMRTVEKRKEALKKSGRCYVCLRRGHISRECRSRARCPKCNGKHHLAICHKPTSTETQPSALHVGSALVEPSSQEAALNPSASPFQPTTPSSSTLLVKGKGSVLLQTAKVCVYNPTNPELSLTTRAILDTGSQRSYTTKRVEDALGLKPFDSQRMSIATFGSGDQCVQAYDLVKLGVSTRDGSGQLLDLITVPFICQPLTTHSIDSCTSVYPHLSGLDLADSYSGDATMEIDLLIGSDHYWDFATGDVRRGDSGPVAIRTTLGWVLSGAVPVAADQASPLNFLVTHTLRVDTQASTEPLDKVLHSFWNLESLGIQNTEESVHDEFTKTIQFKGGRYEVALPWKNPHTPLPDNYELSVKRLQGLLRRLKERPTVMREYDNIIQNQLKQGVVEEVRESDNPTNDKLHYLPHHAVIRTDKETTKIRIVYDASAKSSGCSLNDCLHVGPKFEQRILDILLRFRSFAVALAADIEKAFLQVSVSEDDRDALRFLWIDDATSAKPNIRILRFARVVFGVSSSPFLLNATLQHHLNRYSSTHPRLVQRLTRSTYVDDIICGANEPETAYHLYEESKSILKEGGFNLRRFITNVPHLQQKINEKEGVPYVQDDPPLVHDSIDTYAKETLGTGQPIQSGEQKVLGVRWNPTTDRLCYNVDDIARQAKNLEPTKRNLISVVGRFYDPVGYLSPVVIRFKMLFQALCEEKRDWDQLLTGDILRRWNALVSELQSSPSMTMPRYFLDGIPSEVTSYRLRGFCDASKDAYAAVVYLLIETCNGVFTRFVASKTRVSPLKPQSIPRLELLSALLLARLMHSVSNSLEPELTLAKPVCYTDSKVALFWIVGMNKTWKQFVQHRVSEIRKLLPSDCWRHCPGVENPADLPSRGLDPMALSLSSLWTNGPEWLKDPVDAGNADGSPPMPAECAVEMKIKDRDMALNLFVAGDCPSLDQVIRCEDFSSFQALLNVTSCVLQFIENLKRKVRTSSTDDEPSTSESPSAEVLWIKETQRSLTKSAQFKTLQKQFNLFLDAQGLWRCGGRLSNANVPFNVKHPILMPRDHHLTLLIVRRAHARVLHNGVKDTLNEIRSKFWIVKGRSLVKRIIHQCVLCRRFEGKPCLGPLPPPLPEFRVKESPPFTYTGVDFAGPLFIRTGSAVSDSKVWICLYTCGVTRAIHLDIVPDLTTSAFIRSLKRFSARRGLPMKLVSDNGKTFKAAARAIRAIMKQDEVKQYLSGRGVDWSFNIERAPWWGGFFERMVRMTKRCLKKMIGRAKLNYDELVTAVTEVEAVINSRPLSYISSDDLDEPLTPAHLLTGRRLLSLPDCQVSDDDLDISPELLSKRMRFLNSIVDNFWYRWKKEYLLELRDAHRYGARTSEVNLLSEGDVVLVHEDNKPRGFWRLAYVKSLIDGNDGRTRGAILTVISPNERRMTLRRPLQRLYPLEVKAVKKPDVIDNEGDNASGNSDEEQAVSRPRRAAAVEANRLFKTIALHEQEDESS